MRRYATPIAVFLVLALSGCEDLSDNLAPVGALRIVHAVNDLGPATVIIRGPLQFQALLVYTGGTGPLSLGEDVYPVRVEVAKPGVTDNVEILSFDASVATDQTRIVVLSGTTAAPQVLQWVRDAVSLGAGEAGGGFGHAFFGEGPVDIFVELAGADLSVAMPKASLSYGEFIPFRSIAPGDYQLTVLPQGATADDQILFQSVEFALPEGTGPFFTVLDNADQGTGGVTLRVSGLAGLPTLEPAILASATPSYAPQVRLINGALLDPATGPELTLQSDITMPPSDLVVGLPFEAASSFDDTLVDAEPTTVRIIDAGLTMPGTNLLDADVDIDLRGGSYNTFVAREGAIPTQVFLTSFLDNQRLLADFAQYQLIHSAADEAFVDVYIVPRGASFDGLFPNLQSVAFGTRTQLMAISPEQWDIRITDAGFPGAVRVDRFEVDFSGCSINTLLVTDVDAMPNLSSLTLADTIAGGC